MKNTQPIVTRLPELINTQAFYSIEQEKTERGEKNYASMANITAKRPLDYTTQGGDNSTGNMNLIQSSYENLKMEPKQTMYSPQNLHQSKLQAKLAKKNHKRHRSQV